MMSLSSDKTAKVAKKRRVEDKSQVESGLGRPLTTSVVPSQTLSQSQAYSQFTLSLSSNTPILSVPSQVVTQEVTQMSQFFKDQPFKDICRDCNEPALALDKECIQCDNCRLNYHLDCVDLNHSVYQSIRKSTSVKWFCFHCLKDQNRRQPLIRII